MKRGKALLALSVATVTMLGTTLTASAAAPEYKDLFDAEYYASQYSDLAAAFGDDEEALFQHYLTYGIKEGRSGSDMFNVQNYREQYADLDVAFGDNWQSYLDHYLTYGINEGRDGGGAFDAVSYANRYEDLKDAFGYDFNLLREHYETYGEKEGRNAVSETVEASNSYSYVDWANYTIVVEEDKETGAYRQITQYAPEGYLACVTNYDEEGRMIDWTNYNEAGEVVYQEFYVYDGEDGLLAIEVENSYVDGSSLTKEYVYDTQGRVYGYVNHLTTEPGGEISVYYTSFEYEGDSELAVKEENRDYDGNLLSTTDYDYYDSGAQKTAMYYDCNGVLYYSTEYYDWDDSNSGGGSLKVERRYHDNGQLKSETLYDENFELVSCKEYNEDGTEK